MPKKSRYTLGDKIDNRFLLALEFLLIASVQKGPAKIPSLERALNCIDMLKAFLRLAWKIRAMDEKKYIELSAGLDKAGAQVGGWKKGLQTKTSAN